jgi:SsrA-binding protein
MKEFSRNKKAYFKYHILEKFTAGISLIGLEVKSIRLGGVNLSGAYVVLKDEEVFLIGLNIPPYQPNNTSKNYKPERTRKLLLKKSEIKYLIGKTKQKGLTIVPLRVYNIGRRIKLEFAIAKGKKKFDKRETIKKREDKREMSRKLKEFNK